MGLRLSLKRCIICAFFLFFSRDAWVEIGPAIIDLVRLGFRRLASLASSTLERVCSPRMSSLRLHPIKNPYEVNYRRPYLDPCVSHCGLINGSGFGCGDSVSGCSC